MGTIFFDAHNRNTGLIKPYNENTKSGTKSTVISCTTACNVTEM